MLTLRSRLIALLFLAGNSALTHLDAQSAGPLYPIQQCHKWGYIDHSGKIAIQPAYEEAWAFASGLAPFRLQGKWGYLDGSGRVVIKPRFDEARNFHNGLSPVRMGELWGFVRRDGTFGIPLQYEVARSFQDDVARVRVKGNWGYVRPDGTMAIPPRFQGANGFSEGVAPIKNDGQWGYIDKSGKVILSMQYKLAESFNESLAAVQVGDRWGFINHEGKVVIAPEYEATGEFAENLSPVEKDGKWSFVDRRNKPILVGPYESADHFTDDLAHVTKDGRSMYIDLQGKVVWSEDVSAAACGEVTAPDDKLANARPEDLPTSGLISNEGPSFRVPESELGKVTKVIVYGDQRFTDPTNTKVTNPIARRLLVEKIAVEHPDAVLMNGDVPYSGDVVNDYEVYKTETKIWRDEHLHIYPALGNHEFHGNPKQALDRWWSAFPELTNRRWYSVELGRSIYTIALDSDTSLRPGSDQIKWLTGQLTHLPKSTRFVFLSMHHPPVADFQEHINVSHNPRPNEIALRDFLNQIAPTLQAKMIVTAGHIRNYERFNQAGVTYLVSGGGAASPVEVERKPADLYQDLSFPNYHFVEFLLQGTSLHAQMHRLVDASASTPAWEVKDSFVIDGR